jgi:pterin-4a-carbinolamine dehydratase
MEDYFRDRQTRSSLISEVTEVVSKFSNWETIESPQRLIKDFQFTSRSLAYEFLRQIMLYENEVLHYGKLTLEGLNVRIEVFTSDIDSITNLDYEYAEFVEQIFVDVCEYA